MSFQDLAQAELRRCPETHSTRRLAMPKAVTLIRSNALSDAAEYAYAATAPAEARLIFLA